MDQLCIAESIYRSRNWFPNVNIGVFILIPHLRTRSFVSNQNCRNWFPNADTVWSFLCVFRVFTLMGALESSVGERFGIFDPNPSIDFDFAITRCSSPGFSSRCGFRFVNWSGKRLQKNIAKLTMLSERKRWFHSSLVKFPVVNWTATWFSVSTSLIWIYESELILSDNHSSATL